MFRYLNGFHIITYALHIYFLNLFIAFLTPKVDPMSYDDALDEDESDGQLPTRGGEFKPFIRRLPEFKVPIEVLRCRKLSISVVLVLGDESNVHFFCHDIL